jgi:hypothetical protein
MSVRSRTTCTSTVLPSTIDGVNSGATNVVKTRLALVVDSQMFWNVCCSVGPSSTPRRLLHQRRPAVVADVVDDRVVVRRHSEEIGLHAGGARRAA